MSHLKLPAFIHFSDGRGWTVATVLADDYSTAGRETTFRLKDRVIATLSPEQLWISRSPQDVRRDGHDLHFWVETPRTRDHGLPDFESEIAR